MELQPLHVDNHLLVVCKPAGLPTVPDSSGDESLLERAKAWIRREYEKPGAVFLGVVQRLDRPVSGVLCFARTSKAARRLSAARCRLAGCDDNVIDAPRHERRDGQREDRRRAIGRRDERGAPRELMAIEAGHHKRHRVVRPKRRGHVHGADTGATFNDGSRHILRGGEYADVAARRGGRSGKWVQAHLAEYRGEFTADEPRCAHDGNAARFRNRHGLAPLLPERWGSPRRVWPASSVAR